MGKYSKMIANLGKEEEAWLNYKAGQGYKKAALLRNLIRRAMEQDEGYVKAMQKAREERPARVDATEFVSELCKEKDLDPKVKKVVEYLDWGFKHLDELAPDATMALGILKEKIECISEMTEDGVQEPI